MIGLKKMFVMLTSVVKVGDNDQVPTPHLVPWCQDNMISLQLTAVKSSYGMYDRHHESQTTIGTFNKTIHIVSKARKADKSCVVMMIQ